MNRIKKDKKHNEISLKKAFGKIIIYSSIFFVIGYVYDICLSLLTDNITLAISDIVSLLLAVVIMLLWKRQKISDDSTLLLNMIIISINLSITIIFKGIVDNEDAPEKILFCMCVFMIPVVFTSLTKVRAAPYIITILAILSYATSSILIKNTTLFMYMPILLLIYIGAPVLLNMLIIASKQIEREKILVTGEKKEFFKKMNLNQEQMELIINPNVRNKKEAEEMLEKMDNKIRDMLVAKVREAICSTENTRAILKQRLPEITESELEISVMIIDGKTVSEICHIRHVSPSTITSTRSRLRHKLGLKDNDGLKDYLTSTVNGVLIDK